MEYTLMESIFIKVFGFFDVILSSMPTFEVEFIDTMIDSIQYIANLVYGASILIPVTDIFIILTIIIAYRMFFVGLFIANWIIRRIADLIP